MNVHGDYMKFKNVLFATDFDATLTDSGGKIPQKNIDAIRYFISEGGRFTVCTGRSYLGFHLYSPEYINAPVLLSNGAAAYDYPENKLIFNDALGEECLPVLREIRDTFPNAGIEMYPFEAARMFSINLTPFSEQHFTSQGIEFVQISDPAEAILPFTKVMIAAHGGISQAVQELIAKHPEVNYLKTTGDFVEILKKGVDKGSGLLKLGRHLGCAEKDIYAAGDGYNDVDMLRAANAGFAPENGSKEALAAAKYITRSNDDGCIAHAVEILDGIYK